MKKVKFKIENEPAQKRNEEKNKKLNELFYSFECAKGNI